MEPLKPTCQLCQHAHAWSSGRTTRSWSTPRLRLLLNLFIHPSECFGWHAHFLVLRGARWVWVLRGYGAAWQRPWCCPLSTTFLCMRETAAVGSRKRHASPPPPWPNVVCTRVLLCTGGRRLALLGYSIAGKSCCVVCVCVRARAVYVVVAAGSFLTQQPKAVKYQHPYQQTKASQISSHTATPRRNYSLNRSQYLPPSPSG